MIAWFRRWIGWEEVDAVAVTLAEIFCRHVSVSQAAKSTLVDKALLLVLAQAKGEKRKRQWGGNKTARLANTFGWRLVALGYSEELALPLAKKLAVQLSQNNYQ